jgi:hypothetical protein
MPDGAIQEPTPQDQLSDRPPGPLSHPLLGNRRPAARADAHESRVAPPINIRVTIPILGKRFYVAILAGKERRGDERLALERRRNRLFTKVNVLFLIAGITALYALTLGVFLAFNAG